VVGFLELVQELIRVSHSALADIQQRNKIAGAKLFMDEFYHCGSVANCVTLGQFPRGVMGGLNSLPGVSKICENQPYPAPPEPWAPIIWQPTVIV